MNKILLYTDQPIADIGFRHVLEWSPLFVLPPCSSVEGLAGRIQADGPDVIVIDLTGEVTFGVLQDLREATTAHLVLWAESIDTEFAFQAAQIGVRGIVRKSMPAQVQLTCLQKIAAGELWFEKVLADRFLCSRREKVTSREAQLVALVAQGQANKEVAYTLGITEGTVKVYLSRLFEKLGCKNRYQLALWGLKNLGNSPATAVAHAPREILIPAA